MKRIPVIIVTAVAAAVAVAGCTSSGITAAQRKESQQQAADTTTLVNNQPIPHFSYSQERAALIAAETAAANGTQTTTFFFNQGVTDPIFTCPSIGMGVPDSASLSNPVQAQWNTAGSSGVAGVGLGQMDPFGIYVPTSSTGTYVICVNAQGQEYLVRWEGFVQTVTAPAVWDAKTHSEKIIGAPTQPIRTKKTP